MTINIRSLRRTLLLYSTYFKRPFRCFLYIFKFAHYQIIKRTLLTSLSFLYIKHCVQFRILKGPLGAKVGKNLIKNLTNRILNTFETTYQILGVVLIFNLHNLVFRTVAQEQHWPLQYEIEMKKLRTYNMQNVLNNIVTIGFNMNIYYIIYLLHRRFIT